MSDTVTIYDTGGHSFNMPKEQADSYIKGNPTFYSYENPKAKKPKAKPVKKESTK